MNQSQILRYLQEHPEQEFTRTELGEPHTVQLVALEKYGWIKKRKALIEISGRHFWANKWRLA